MCVNLEFEHMFYAHLPSDQSRVEALAPLVHQVSWWTGPHLVDGALNLVAH